MVRIGSYLERDIAILFKRIGFNVFINSKKYGFEADIIAEKEGLKILIQTKQYDHAYINISDLLYQWESKGKHIGADRTLIVITGFNIPDKKFELAENLGVYLWDDKVLHKLKIIESNKLLYGKIGKLLEFDDIMEKFKRIEESKLDEDLDRNLREKVIQLSTSDFNRELKKVTQDQIKRKTEKKKNEINWWIIIFFIYGLFLMFGIISNNIKDKEEFVIKCIGEWSNRSLLQLKNIKIVKNYQSALSWVKLRGGNETILSKLIQFSPEVFADGTMNYMFVVNKSVVCFCGYNTYASTHACFPL